MADEPKPQIDKFRDLARELEADEDEAAFEEKVRKIAGKSSFERVMDGLDDAVAHGEGDASRARVTKPKSGDE